MDDSYHLLFHLVIKEIALKKRKGAPKHIWSIQRHKNKRKTENKGRTPEKPQKTEERLH
jgi:hypothetical protein